MKDLIRWFSLGAFLLGQPTFLLSHDRGEFLNFAILNLPPEYFAGIPLDDRPALFREISSGPRSKEIDYDSGYFFHRRETEPNRLPALLWLRLLPRDQDPPVQNPYSPLVYVHVATPENPGAAPEEASYRYETRVAMWKRRNRDEAGRTPRKGKIAGFVRREFSPPRSRGCR